MRTSRLITESTFVSLDGIADDPRAWAMSFFDEQAQQSATAAQLDTTVSESSVHNLCRQDS